MPTKDFSTRKPMGSKRLIALGLTITLGFLAISASVLWDARIRDRDEAQRSAANVVATLSSEIGRNLEIYDLSLQAVVEGLALPEVQASTPKVRNLILFDKAATAKDMGAILVLDRSGTVIINSVTLTPTPENFADADFFKVHVQDSNIGRYLSRPYRSARGEYQIALTRRLSGPDGSFLGVVVGTVPLSYFHNLFRKVSVGDQDALNLIRDDGSNIMRSPFDIDVIGRDLSQSPVFQRIAQHPSGSFEHTATIDGVERMYVHQRVGDQPLIVGYGMSLKAIYAGWRSEALTFGLLMLALCLTNIALVAFLARAVKQHRDAEDRLAIIATIDGLTGLCNRRRLDEVFDAEWRRAQRERTPVSLLMIDADNFKDYNDTFGHQAGDEALCVIARAIQNHTRRGVEVGARYGGEEFAVLLPGTALNDALNLAERIRASVESLRDGQPGETPTISVGVASMIPRENIWPRDLIEAADKALYGAKSGGRNRCNAPRPAGAAEIARQFAAA